VKAYTIIPINDLSLETRINIAITMPGGHGNGYQPMAMGDT
jgi:hypothetical protein